MSEVQRGEGPWRITYEGQIPVMVEIWVAEGQRVVIGLRQYESGCARCGAIIATVTPDNDEADVCDPCYARILAEVAG